MDRTGFARGTLAVREGLNAAVPALDPVEWLTMADMMGAMDHGAMGHGGSAMGAMDHAAMGHDMSGMKHDMSGMNHGGDGDGPWSARDAWHGWRRVGQAQRHGPSRTHGIRPKHGYAGGHAAHQS